MQIKIDYLLIFILLIMSSYAYYNLAKYYNIIDNPNHRSSHTTPVIRGGGILFYIALLLFFIFSEFQYPYLFVAATLIGGLSFIDDLKPLPPILRFPFQCIAVILVFVQLNIEISWILYPILFVISVGFINAFNFMDGINGITAIYSGVILFFSLLFNLYHTLFISMDLLVYLLISVIIFGFYNFRKKAKFFAGDVGSITMAICVLFIILSLFETTKAISVFLIVGVYGVDSVITIIRRIKLNEKITDAHRHHLYQYLVDLNILSHLQVAGVYGFLQGILFIIFVYSLSLNFLLQLVLTIAILLLLVFLYFIVLNKLILIKNHKGL